MREGGKQTTVTGAAARAIDWIARYQVFINAPDTAGVIELHVGSQDENVKAKYDVTPKS